MGSTAANGLEGIIVGCGYFGHIHLEGWGGVEHARIVAAVDLDGRRAKAAAQQFGIADYCDLEDALTKERPDFVDIATRPDSHLRVAQHAASEGCHILCQKPMATTLDDAKNMVEEIRKAGVKAIVEPSSNTPLQGVYAPVRQLLDRGVLGQSRGFPRWDSDRRSITGVSRWAATRTDTRRSGARTRAGRSLIRLPIRSV